MNVKNMKIQQLYLARKSKDFKSNIELKESALQKAVEKGENRRVIYHYTNIESLFKILEKGYFKFSRIDRVNDPMETKELAVMDMYKRVFIACFSHEEEESIPLWKIYTNRGNGVRIGFAFKDISIHTQFIDYNRPFLDINNYEIFKKSEGPGPITLQTYLKIIEVDYCDEAYKNHWLSLYEDCIHITPDDLAYTKSKEWEYEKETRLVLHHRDFDEAPLDTGFVLVPIDFARLEAIEVRFDPWMTPELIDCYTAGIEKYKEKWGVVIKPVESDLCGRIM